ncbi:MAG: DNA polymerase III subunit delta [Verrucomicrobia bacterium]|nr:MAG: DNA polymerase III subunit delta [Verrucomicrobiota bacterium]
MPSGKQFTFIYGPDDYLVDRLARERFAKASEGLDDFSCDTINGSAANVGEVEAIVKQFRDAVQTMGLFGGRRAVWLKDVNFLADTVTGRAESTLKLVEDLREILEAINPAEVSVILSASPVDRRRSFPKWCEKHAETIRIGDGGRGAPGIDWKALADEECRRWDVQLAPDALELLVAKTNGNARLFIGEIQKLATYLDEPGGTITEALVDQLVPVFGEGDFFEATEAFFAGDLGWTLDALHRHFFAGHDARPVLASLQNRNRLLIQLRALLTDKQIRLGPRGVDKASFERASLACRDLFGSAFTEKSGFNVFTQNPWYLGKVAGDPEKLPPLKRLIDNQLEFVRTFEKLLGTSDKTEQEETLRAMAVRCLAGT